MIQEEPPKQDHKLTSVTILLKWIRDSKSPPTQLPVETLIVTPIQSLTHKEAKLNFHNIISIQENTTTRVPLTLLTINLAITIYFRKSMRSWKNWQLELLIRVNQRDI